MLRTMRKRRRRGGAVAMLVASIIVAPVLSACSGLGNQDVVRVPGDAGSISDAVARVAEGGIVIIEPGVYRESVMVDTPGITLRGIDRNAVVIDGEGKRSQGIVVTADGVSVENLTVRNHTFYGLLFTGLFDDAGPQAHGLDGYDHLDPEKFPPIQRFHASFITAANNGLYGIYAFDAQQGVIEYSYASGSSDSGIYVGQCRYCNIVVRQNIAEHNAVGFENANASDSVWVVNNRLSRNRVGALITTNYQEAFVPQRKTVIAGNVISDNNEADSPAQATGAFGIGVALTGAQENTIRNNRITGNPRVGLLLANNEDVPSAGNEASANNFDQNGVDVANTSATRAPATGNCLSGNSATTALPQSIILGCASPGDAAASTDLPSVEVPPGRIYLEVTAPGPQPNSPDAENTQPRKLPARVDPPDLSSISAPSPDFIPSTEQSW